MKYKDRESLAKRRMKHVIKFSRLKKHQGVRRITPSVYSNDPHERSLGLFLSSIKCAKWNPGGKNTRVFYPSLVDVAIEQGAPTILEPIRTKGTAVSKLQETLDWIALNGRLPKQKSTRCIEKDHAVRLRNLTAIKNGTLQGVWYSEYDEMLASAGYPDFFKCEDSGKLIDADVDDLCRFYKRYSRVPSQLSPSCEERKLYRKLVRYRQVKNGKTVLLWNPEIDEKIKAKKIKNFF